MKLVLVSMDGSSGELRLISDRPCATRDEAFAELRRALSSGEVDASRDLFLLDLDASSPVVIMSAPVEAATPFTVEPVEEVFGAAAVEDAATELAATEEPTVAVEPEAEAELMATAPPAVEEGGEPTSAPEEAPIGSEPVLAAADAGEGPQPEAAEEYPPAAVEAPAEEPTVAVAVSEDPTLAALKAALTSDVEVEGGTTPESEAQPVTTPAPPVQWPWEAEGASQQDDLAAEAAATETSGAEPESGSPVVPAASAEAEATPDAGGEPVIQAVAEPAGVTAAAAVASAAVEDSPEDAAEHGYEPGALNMNQYTCDDCVYATTCPNKDQKAPAACGSFQWKSV